MDKKTTNIIFGVVAFAIIAYILVSFVGKGSSKVFYTPAVEALDTQKADIKDSVLNTNALGQKLVNATGEESFVISPSLIANSLGVYALGAQEEGHDEVVGILGIEENIKENLAALNASMDEILGQDSKTVKALIVDKSVKPTDEFLEVVKYSGTYFASYDFKDFAEVKRQVNEYANKQTVGKISSLVKEIYPNTQFMFVSGIDFNAKFENVFDGAKVNEGKLSATKAKVYYYKDNNGTYVRMPLDNCMSYEVLMPESMGDLSLAEMNEYRNKAKLTVVGLTMPDTKIDSYADLNDALMSLEVKAPFENKKLIKPLTTSAQLVLDGVEQNVSISIETQGQNAGISESATANVNINKPYFYAVTDTNNNNSRVILGKHF